MIPALVFSSVKMPRAGRLQKFAAQQLQNSAKATGQTSLAVYFQRPDNDPVRLDDEKTGTIAVTSSSSAGLQEEAAQVAEVPLPSTASVYADPWIKTGTEFTENEKILSENKGRYCQADWFTEHQWLWYHRPKRAVFCSVCTQHKQQHDNSPFIFSETESAGFHNWKKGKERLSEHERSDDHRSALAKARKIQRNVASELDKQVNELQQQRRKGLVSHLNTLKTILRQGIAVRGHTDEESNIVQFNKDKAIDNPALALFLAENQYMGHEILTEQEELLVLTARRRLIHEINDSGFYAIICDESSDISKIEQLSFSVRYCTEKYEIAEDFIGVMPCDKGLTSEALLTYVQDIMVRCSMDTNNMIAMAFDGASAMKQLASLLKTRISKHAVYVHCFAHCNELVFKDASSLSSVLSDAQDFCENVYVLAGMSPKRVLLFQNVQKEMSAVADTDESYVTLKLKNLSRTRWTARSAAADVVLQKYHALQETLMVLSTDKSVTAECRATCEGILRKLKSFPQMFKLVAMYELASLLENNSKQLQSASLTAEQASTCIDKMCIRLDELRTNEEFERLITKVETITGLAVCVEPVGSSVANSGQQEEQHEISTSRKRKRTCPAKMTDFVVHSKTANATSTLNEKAELKRLFFETLDAVKNAAKSRFDQDDLQILKSIERFIVSAANKEYSVSEPADLMKNLTKLSEIIDLQQLMSEAQELPVYIKLYNRKSLTPITNATKVSTLCEVMNSVSDSKDCLPQIHKLLKLYMSVPLGSATAERTFSAMRRVKSWLRSAMSSNTLNNRLFSTIHKQRIDEVSALDVAKEFVEVNEQRRMYFGHYD